MNVRRTYINLMCYSIGLVTLLTAPPHFKITTCFASGFMIGMMNEGKAGTGWKFFVCILGFFAVRSAGWTSAVKNFDEQLVFVLGVAIVSLSLFWVGKVSGKLMLEGLREYASMRRARSEKKSRIASVTF
jgi:hypothetical protein